MTLKRRTFLRSGLAALLVAASGITACATAPSISDEPVSTIYLVRHAEKEKGPDPALTEAGMERADRLATRLSDAGLSKIWSTDTRRTRETAGPISKMTGTEVSIYDGRDLDNFAEQLRATGGNHLVVGHSNTTPVLASALGDDPTPFPVVEATEYDRLYIVLVFADRTQTVLERY